MGTTTENDALNEEELSNLARRAHRTATRRTREEEFGGDYDDLDDDIEGEFDGDEPELDPKRFTKEQIIRYYGNKYDETDNWDIFTDIGAELSKKSVFIKYQVRKSGKIFTHVDHPYSWEELQREHGEGTYCVIAKTIDGKTITKQTQVLDKAPFRPEKETETTRTKNGVPTGGMELMEYMDRKIAQEREQAKRDAKERQNELFTMLNALKPERPDNSETKGILEVLTAMITTQNSGGNRDSSTEILMKMQEMNMNMFKEMNEKQERMFEKMSDRTERMFDQLKMEALSDKGNDPNAIDQWKLLELLEKAKSEGFDQMKMINEIAEQRAQVLSDKPQESLTDSVLKSLLPLATQMAANKNGGGSSYADIPNPNQRRALPQGQTANGQGTHGGTGQGQTPHTQKANGQGGVPRRPVRRAAPAGISVFDVLETGNTTSTTKKPAGTATGTNNAPRNDVNVEPNPQNAKINLANKEKILNLAIPVVVDGFTNKQTTDEAVEITLQRFRQEGIDLTTVTRDFSNNDVKALINQYSLPPELGNLLREYYGKLVERVNWENRQVTNN